ncbi:hypothetical protein BDA99DRAFT_594262 [Phascolomyces articulosus]|uniref:Uncharacterized protein n=1 Tax=Phascolomyces articulosus TaxID=60185 RepID=A0AAD5JLA8_9FUNG|nr:hypothetical protein BDA99DRAFT_594262 [Phascolomyces articulosus]
MGDITSFRLNATGGEYRPTFLVRTSDWQVVPGYEAVHGYCALSYCWEQSGEMIKKKNGEYDIIDEGHHQIVTIHEMNNPRNYKTQVELELSISTELAAPAESTYFLNGSYFVDNDMRLLFKSKIYWKIQIKKYNHKSRFRGQLRLGKNKNKDTVSDSSVLDHLNARNWGFGDCSTDQGSRTTTKDKGALLLERFMGCHAFGAYATHYYQHKNMVFYHYH